MKWVITGIASLGILFTVYSYHYVALQTPLGTLEPIEFEIRSGSTPLSVSRELSTSPHIHLNHPWLTAVLFRIYYLRYPLQAGVYQLQPQETLFHWLKKFQKGHPKLYPITLIEGLTLKEIAQVFQDTQIVDNKEDFLAWGARPEILEKFNIPGPTIEGYFFPSTYYLPQHYNAHTVIEKALRLFQEKVQNPLFQTPLHPYFRSPHDYIILASIIEKETGDPQERYRISGVFHNRMRKNMRLESDPTTIYGLKDFDGNLLRHHLELWTPYNTYRLEGLPLGPICNPGFEAIDAAYHPEPHAYLFFVSKNDGTHVFSEDYTQHQKNVKKYQPNR